MNFTINTFKLTALIIGALFFFIYFSIIGFEAFRGGLLTLTLYLTIAIFAFPFVADTFNKRLRKSYFFRSIMYIALYLTAPFVFIALLIFNHQGGRFDGR